MLSFFSFSEIQQNTESLSILNENPKLKVCWICCWIQLEQKLCLITFVEDKFVSQLCEMDKLNIARGIVKNSWGTFSFFYSC